MQPRKGASLLKTAGQVVAIILLTAYGALLLHKGVVDISAIARAYPGADFLPALGRHVMRILGGG